ncbi:MAG: hypothetical protein ACREQZ_09950, partial [Woeseiaceae bacterium]
VYGLSLETHAREQNLRAGGSYVYTDAVENYVVALPERVFLDRSLVLGFNVMVNRRMCGIRVIVMMTVILVRARCHGPVSAAFVAWG